MFRPTRLDRCLPIRAPPGIKSRPLNTPINSELGLKTPTTPTKLAKTWIDLKTLNPARLQTIDQWPWISNFSLPMLRATSWTRAVLGIPSNSWVWIIPPHISSSRYKLCWQQIITCNSLPHLKMPIHTSIKIIFTTFNPRLYRHPQLWIRIIRGEASMWKPTAWPRAPELAALHRMVTTYQCLLHLNKKLELLSSI